VRSALPPKADIAGRQLNVRFVPKADTLRCGKERRYSITSSARAMSFTNGYILIRINAVAP
jgi:hypothetical protein